MSRMRLDEALVASGLAPSRARARDMVLRGGVFIDGEAADKPARMVAPEAVLRVDDPLAGYVSRAALKLVAGLDAFGFSPAGLTVLDLGASTGGFTQVLLERGAAGVIAVDVGHGQLHPSIAADPRVRAYEGLNARALSAAHLENGCIGAVVADLSFISLKLALPTALALAEAKAWGVFPVDTINRQKPPWLVALVKPQFEVGREHVGKGGIVRDPVVAKACAEWVARWLEDQGWRVVGLIPSPITGSDGNQEWLLGAVKQ